MKAVAKILMLAACYLHANVALSQSTFLFYNVHPQSGLDAAVFDAEGNRLRGTTYVAMLYGGATSDSLSPAFFDLSSERMSPVPFTVMFNGQAGYFAMIGFVTVQIPPGVPAWLQVRAWDTRMGATYEEVRARGLGGYGESLLFQKVGGNPGGGVATLPEPLTGLQSFSLIPEPSSFMLLLLGVPWLILQHRRAK